jgi:hypothetical protein
MLNTEEFFQTQIKECLEHAKRAATKQDRHFWEAMAERWSAIQKRVVKQDGREAGLVAPLKNLRAKKSRWRLNVRRFVANVG